MKTTIFDYTLTALMTAIICILGPIVIPIGMIPLSFANLAIYLAIILMGKKRSLISVLLYLLIGFIGIPVFSGFTGGAGKLLGPTGGYLLGYVALAWIAGWIIEIWESVKNKNVIKEKQRQTGTIAGLTIGTIVLYLLGTCWLAAQAQISFKAALATGVLPFIIADSIKIIIATFLGTSIKKRLRHVEF